MMGYTNFSLNGDFTLSCLIENVFKQLFYIMNIADMFIEVIFCDKGIQVKSFLLYIWNEKALLKTHFANQSFKPLPHYYTLCAAT